MSDLETEPRPSRRLWVFAAAAALALHLGCGALAIAHLRRSESDDALGANAIEVGIEFASVRREVTDLPPGPDSDASVASPALAEQQAEVKETELPKDVPTEPEEADRVVTPNETNKPKEDDPKIAAVQTQASTELVASEATATLSSEAIPEGPRSVSPAIGSGESARRVRATWRRNWLPISTSTSAIRRNVRRRAPRSWSRSRSTAWAACSQAPSSRDRATPPSTKQPSRC